MNAVKPSQNGLAAFARDTREKTSCDKRKEQCFKKRG